jgi:hypothetical protein
MVSHYLLWNKLSGYYDALLGTMDIEKVKRCLSNNVTFASTCPVHGDTFGEGLDEVVDIHRRGFESVCPSSIVFTGPFVFRKIDANETIVEYEVSYDIVAGVGFGAGAGGDTAKKYFVKVEDTITFDADDRGHLWIDSIERCMSHPKPKTEGWFSWLTSL